MNHTAYRHVSMPCPVMRGSLWLILGGGRGVRDAPVTPGTERREWWADAPAEPRTPRSAQLLNRKLAHSEMVEHDMSEPG